MKRATPLHAALSSFACLLALFAAACGGAPPKARTVEPVLRDTPQVFRGVVGAETTINGIEPVLVSGIGLVVGLNGTGGGPYPAAVQASMERELARGGIGRGGPLQDGPMAGMSPRAVLSDPNVTIVVVEGAIPPGAPDDAPFDVVVRTLPGSAATSLEGGTLWTCELRLGPAAPFGMARTRKLAEARGPIFLNPFVEPGKEGDARRMVGRVLGGGRVTDGLAMEIRLDNPSHARAASIVSAINNRFALGPGIPTPPARGRSSASIALKVPPAFMDTPDEFIRIVQYTQIDQAFPEEYAKRYVDEIIKEPARADELAWCLRALGHRALAFLPRLYDYPELAPRLAGLRTGAALGDIRTAKPLQAIARGEGAPSPSMRAEALKYLGRLGADPSITLFLREMVDQPELEVKIAAYEALVERMDVQRVEYPGKFFVDRVPAKDPLIYVKQQGLPTIVLFGDPFDLRPAVVSAWSDRFMLTSDENRPGYARVFYRDYRTGSVVQNTINADVLSLISWLARPGNPDEPSSGVNLTYSQVVGAIYETQKQGALPGSFATERDLLMAKLLAAQETTTAIEDRPVSEEDRDRVREEAEEAAKRRVAPASPADQGDQPMVVPLGPSGAPSATPR